MLKLSGLVENLYDEVEGLCWAEFFFSPDKFVLIYHLDVEDIIHEAKKQIYLRDHHHYNLPLSIFDRTLQ